MQNCGLRLLESVQKSSGVLLDLQKRQEARSRGQYGFWIPGRGSL